jgi:hypothetical protein
LTEGHADGYLCSINSNSFGGQTELRSGESKKSCIVIFRAVFVSLIVLVGISTIIRMIVSTGKLRNPTLLKLFKRIGQIGSIASGVMFVGGFLFLLVGVILLLAHSK